METFYSSGFMMFQNNILFRTYLKQKYTIIFYTEMGTVQNKSTSVLLLGTFFKKYRGTGTVLCKTYSNSHWRSQKL